MDAEFHPILLWAFVALVTLGLFSTVVARVRLGRNRDRLGRNLFFGSVVLVTVAACVALCLGSSLWLLGGTLLAVMAVGVTWEGSSKREAPVF